MLKPILIIAANAYSFANAFSFFGYTLEKTPKHFNMVYDENEYDKRIVMGLTRHTDSAVFCNCNAWCDKPTTGMKISQVAKSLLTQISEENAGALFDALLEFY